MNRVRQLSNGAGLNVIGLALAAAGMLLQIAAGSQMYPTLAGPIILLVTAVFVALGSRRWTRFAAIVVPLLLGFGAIIAAIMTGEFINQLTNMANAGILFGSLMHVIGLAAAVTGGLEMLPDRRGLVSVEP